MSRWLVATLAVALLLPACTQDDVDRAVDELVDAAASELATSSAPTTSSPGSSTPEPPAVDQVPPFRPPEATVRGVVDRVVDGDTLVVDIGDERERVRLLRIDTPELARDGQPAECLAEAATRQLERFAGPGTQLLLATDVERRDQFGRALMHAWRADDGVWVNGGMLATGYARVVTFPPNTAYDAEVLALQAVARDRDLGLWSSC